jgi:peptidoglycan/LPS O-acetylase OafA/YrhL
MVLVISRLKLGTTTRTPLFAQPWIYMLLWCALSLAFAICLYLWASRKLRREFRERVVAAPKQRKGKWKRPKSPPPLPAG